MLILQHKLLSVDSEALKYGSHTQESVSFKITFIANGYGCQFHSRESRL